MVINHQVLDILKQLVKVSDMNEVKERVLSIIGTILEMNEKDIPDDAAPGVIEKWDSLGQLSLVSSLESHYRTTFEIEEIFEIFTVADIKVLLAKRGIK